MKKIQDDLIANKVLIFSVHVMVLSSCVRGQGSVLVLSLECCLNLSKIKFC